MLLKNEQSLNEWVDQAFQQANPSDRQMIEVRRLANDTQESVKAFRTGLWDWIASTEKSLDYDPDLYKPLTDLSRQLFDLLPGMDLEEARENYVPLAEEYAEYKRILTILEEAGSEDEAKAMLGSEAMSGAYTEAQQIAFSVARDFLR